MYTFHFYNYGIIIKLQQWDFAFVAHKTFFMKMKVVKWIILRFLYAFLAQSTRKALPIAKLAANRHVDEHTLLHCQINHLLALKTCILSVFVKQPFPLFLQ